MKITALDYFNRAISDVRVALNDLRHAYDQRFSDITERQNRYEETQQHLLTGFPEQFAAKADVEAIRNLSTELKGDVIGRERFERFETQTDEKFRSLTATVSESSGRRTAIIGGAGILVAVLAILFTYTLRSGITRSEISDQISKESPWLAERGQIEHRLNVLETRDISLQLQVSQLRSQIKLMCLAEKDERHVSC